MPNTPIFSFDNTYARELEGFYTPCNGDKTPAPQVLRFNAKLASELGLNTADFEGVEGASIFTGAITPVGGAALAMAYAGHQFGGFSPQLGDGRAILVGEILDHAGSRFDLHLKGSGRTPYSRGGDGKAVLGPVLREYLLGEAMFALGIKTTRALAATLTGEKIMRDGYEPGAVLARVAASHLRVGTFQYFAARRKTAKLKQLADYTIARHYPEVSNRDDRYLAFFQKVCETQANLVASWVSIGFVHGVMNTDNMTISGETIDYGPCAFMDSYDPAAVFSSIDKRGRYAYGNQPTIAQWNLSRLAETLIELVNPDDSDDAISQLTDVINAFPTLYQTAWLKRMRSKLGLIRDLPEDLDLANELHLAMEGQNVDFTQLFRALSSAVKGDTSPVRALFDAPEIGFDIWLERYEARQLQEDTSAAARATAMNKVNPIYIPRNHRVEEALAAANEGDMKPFDQLLTVLSNPYVEQPNAESYAMPAPDGFGPYTTFCGT